MHDKRLAVLSPGAPSFKGILHVNQVLYLYRSHPVVFYYFSGIIFPSTTQQYRQY